MIYIIYIKHQNFYGNNCTSTAINAIKSKPVAKIIPQPMHGNSTPYSMPTKWNIQIFKTKNLKKTRKLAYTIVYVIFFL